MNPIAKNILPIIVNDDDLDLFESQYIVPDGITYNSYIIMDENITIMDTVDERKADVWFEQVKEILDGKEPSFLVVNHMEPDHTGGIKLLADAYPNIKIVGNAKTFLYMSQFMDVENLDERKHLVKEGDELNIGEYNLRFVFAPMVHWPEVMVTYETTTKTLFSADAFGKFGISDDEDWACEARRYYYNIVGKYGANVQSLLKKLAGVEVAAIAPLHGPILTENLAYYIDLYDKWSRYQPEEDGVLIAYASIHGNTAKAAEEFKNILAAKGKTNVRLCDLSRCDMAEAIEDAFYNETLVLAAASYDAGVFPPMTHFLHHLKDKNFQNRKIAIIENGSWAPTAAKVIKASLETMKNITLFEPIITIRSRYKASDAEAFENLADAIINK